MAFRNLEWRVVSLASYLYTVWYVLRNIVTMVTKHASRTTLKAQSKLNILFYPVQEAWSKMIR